MVGAFVVMGVLFALVAFALVGSFKAFRARQTFVVYFTSSVNNLNVGAQVKWKGVPVGQVSDIRIRWNQDVLSTEVPVFLQIDLARLGMELDDPETLAREVESGLRARLEMDSLISGMLYVELNYVEDAGPPVFYQKSHVYPELPVVESAFAAIGDIVFDIADNLRGFDFKRLSDNLNASIEKAGRAIDELDAAGLGRSVKSAANSVTSLAGSPKVAEALDEAVLTMRSLRMLSEKLASASEPLPAQFAELSAQALRTMQSFEQTSAMLRAAASDNSETMSALNDALREIAAAARAAKELSAFLERNPNALIGGRQKPEPAR